MNAKATERQLLLATGMLSIAVFAAFAPDAYLPMLLRAFLLPGTVAMGLLAVIAYWRKAAWLALSATVGTLLMGAQVRTLDRVHLVDADGTAFRVFHMNVLQPNTAYATAIDQALASDADLISVQEVDPAWAAQLVAQLAERYPHAHVEPRSNCYGIALFSRMPFCSVRTITLHGSPFIEAEVEVGGLPVRVLAVHTTSPISYGHFRKRNAQLAALGAHLAQDDTATIVVGDLNTVPWDHAYQRFCARSGLRSTTPATQRTWPSVGPLALIPLDHLLLSSGIAPSALRTVHIPGSDHKGLLAELILTKH